MNTSANPLFKLNFQDRLVFIGGSFPIGSTLVWLASSHGDPPCFLMSLVFIFAFPFFFSVFIKCYRCVLALKCYNKGEFVIAVLT